MATLYVIKQWLAGKPPVNGDVHGKIIELNGKLSIAIFDCQKGCSR
jgi:hypothetical protein